MSHGLSGFRFSLRGAIQQVAEKVNLHRLLKNAQMQGSSFDRLRINSPEE
jgi:hypothetical protein